jgi:hypothetical protein
LEIDRCIGHVLPREISIEPEKMRNSDETPSKSRNRAGSEFNYYLPKVVVEETHMILPSKREEFRSLFSEFAKSYLATQSGEIAPKFL